MLTVYGSAMCPNCHEMRTCFDAEGIAYRFVDINETLKNLSAFLALRDHSPAFDAAKENGKIGIPALVTEDGSVRLDWKALLQETKTSVQDGTSCSLSGGC